jgi:hypothetical protein
MGVTSTKHACLTFEVANQSARENGKPRLIVLHTSQAHSPPGGQTLERLARLFDEPASHVSVHIANDARGVDARYVSDERAAFAAGAYDPIALHLEHLDVADQSAWPPEQLESAAAWVAFWHLKWGIPVVHSTHNGVCQHGDLDPTATDCGPTYPLGYVLDRANSLVAAGRSDGTSPPVHAAESGAPEGPAQAAPPPPVTGTPAGRGAGGGAGAAHDVPKPAVDESRHIEVRKMKIIPEQTDPLRKLVPARASWCSPSTWRC